MTKTALDKAVRAWQLYNGALTHTNIRAQQKLYDRAMAASQRVAKATGYDLNRVTAELAQAAASRGRILPRPGQDY